MCCILSKHLPSKNSKCSYYFDNQTICQLKIKSAMKLSFIALFILIILTYSKKTIGFTINITIFLLLFDIHYEISKKNHESNKIIRFLFSCAYPTIRMYSKKV